MVQGGGCGKGLREAGTSAGSGAGTQVDFPHLPHKLTDKRLGMSKPSLSMSIREAGKTHRQSRKLGESLSWTF